MPKSECPYIIIYKRIYSDYATKYKIMQLFTGENTEENLCNLGLGMDFLDNTLK